MSDVEADLDEVVRRAGEVEAASRLLLDDVRSSFRGSSSPVSVQERSANSKLAPQRVEVARSGRKRFVPTGPFVVSTYVSIAATCPDSCAFKSGGCYAQAGASHLTMRGLDRAALGLVALDVTLAEAAAIDRLWVRGVPQDGADGGRDLRLHVGGEVSCAEGARALAAAVTRYQARGGGRCWTYTHRWRSIPREAWGPISVLASCERLADAEAARARGYAVAIVVPRYPDGPATWPYAGGRALPCPAEASDGATCSSCRACMDDRRLRERGLVIAFAVHGRDDEDAAAAVRRLPVLP